MNVYDMIAQQQKGREGTDVWMVGEQLKDIIRGRGDLEELVREDLAGHTLVQCAAKLKEHADGIHKKNGGKSGCVCITPAEAEKIIRVFFGLPEGAAREEPAPQQKRGRRVIDLADYLR